MTRTLFVPLLAILALSGAPALAGLADVLDVVVQCKPGPGKRPSSVCNFSVTVKHADQGWDHYANRWEILAEDGTVLATRVLRHPHVDEQPFTRSMGRIRLKAEVERVRVRAVDSQHGAGGAEKVVEIPHAVSDEKAAAPDAPPSP